MSDAKTFFICIVAYLQVSAINYSPDGRYLCLATDEGIMRVYQLPCYDEFEEPEEFIGEAEMISRFYELQVSFLV